MLEKFMDQAMVIPVILSGGAGSRLSPVSTPEKPKQFLPLGLSGAPLLLETAARLQICADAHAKDIHILTLKRYAEMVEALLPSCPLILESSARNTGPAIALGVSALSHKYDEDTILWICPSDHTVENPAALRAKLKEAVIFAQRGYIVTFGIKPARPETGYGYVKAAPDGRIETFTEKPDIETAQSYLKSGGYFWNSGMFVATIETLRNEFETHAPGLLSGNQSIPFDKVIMEKTDKGFLIPCPDLGWSDVGNFEHLEKINKA